MNGTGSVQVVIASAGHGRFIEDCLESIQVCGDTSVVVIDDTDHHELRGRLGSYHTSKIIPSVHHGVACNWNLGIKQAIASDAQWVCLLNDDVVVTEHGWLENLLKAATNDSIGLVVPAGCCRVNDALWSTLSFDERGIAEIPVVDEINWITGYCLLVPRRVFSEFRVPEIYDYFFDEIEYCYVIRNILKLTLICTLYDPVRHVGDDSPSIASRRHRDSALVSARVLFMKRRKTIDKRHTALEDLSW